MHLRRLVAMLAVTLVGAVLLGAPALAAKSDGADHRGRPLSTPLTGAEEVPGPGDPDGAGSATINVKRGKGELCYELSVEGIAPATAAHVHVAPAGDFGPVVVPLMPPTSGFSSGCVDIDRELAKAIKKDPDNYYVNVHNAEFPAGALRGQLGD